MKKANIKKKKTNNVYLLDQLQEINMIAHKMKKSTIFILKDILECRVKYKADLEDYMRFEMYRLNKYERKTIVTQGINNDYIVKYNDPKYLEIFQNKGKFNQTFQNYINREWCEIKEKNKFAIFCLNHKKAIVKPVNSMNGEKIEKINISDYKLKELYEKLIEQKQTLIEEPIVQNNEMNKLNSSSINTICITTLLGSIVSAYLKIGTEKNITDSFHVGGIIAPIDLETGIVNAPAINKIREQFENHPETKENIIDFAIPRWKELQKECEELALEVPQVGYVSWSFAIGKEKIYLVKGNAFPEHNLYGLPENSKNNVGLLPTYKQAEEREYNE